MAKFEVSPVYTETTEKYSTSDPGHADVFNEKMQILLDNDNYLNKEMQAGGNHIGPEAPENVNKIWIDTSVGGVAKYYDGETWTPVLSVWS